MGVAPSWNSDFLYTATKLLDVGFYEKNGEIVWDELFLENAVEYLKSWTTENNTSTTSESDFKFILSSQEPTMISGFFSSFVGGKLSTRFSL